MYVVCFPDNVTLIMDGVLYLRVKDPYKVSHFLSTPNLINSLHVCCCAAIMKGHRLVQCYFPWTAQCLLTKYMLSQKACSVLRTFYVFSVD